MSDALFISPHLDDAALSCGGGISRLVGAGGRVTVVSVFTADPPANPPLSPLARRAHVSWGLGDAPFLARRAEDAAALAILGAETRYLGLLDAVYRRSPSGDPLYQRMLEAPAPDDVDRLVPALEALLTAAVEAAPDTRVFCPEGVGGHPDHVLVRRAVEAVAPAASIVYYEDFPYSARSGAGTSASGTGSEQGLASARLALTPAEIDARVSAIECYASQLRGLFPSASERLLEVVSARVPGLGARLLRASATERARQRARERVRRAVTAAGTESYRWPQGATSPFPAR